MKKIISIIVFIASSFGALAQTSGGIVQGTLVMGSAANKVKAILKPSTTFSGNFSNVQITLQIPSTITPRPTVTMSNNMLAANIPTYTPVPGTEGGFYTYLFNALPVASPTYNFVAGTEIPLAEFDISGSTGTSTVRQVHLADGGTSTGQFAFYVEINGNDNTNYATMFYGSGASNGGSYSANSFIPVANVVVPLRITDFKASRSGENGLLNWTVENETAQNSHFEIERSLNGTSFTKVGQVSVTANGNSTNIYNFSDLNITSLQHKGVLYYRLKQLDRDGQFVYSVVKSIRLDQGKISSSLYPNPAANFSTLSLDLPEAMPIIVNVTDINGKAIENITTQGNKGLNQQRLDLTKYASGTYNLRVQAGTETQTLTLVKSK